MSDNEDTVTVHQTDLNAGHIGKRIKGTTGSTGIDFEGVLTAVHHEIEAQVRSVQDFGTPVRIQTRTTVTVSGHEFKLARGSSVVIP